MFTADQLCLFVCFCGGLSSALLLLQMSFLYDLILQTLVDHLPQFDIPLFEGGVCCLSRVCVCEMRPNDVDLNF